jgi:hypothetical protein
MARKPHLERADQGTVEGRTLTVTTDPQRIIWTATPFLDVNNLPDEPSTLGPFPAARDWFVHLMRRWLVNYCPSIKRLAFTGKLAQFTNSHEVGYRRLGKYLPHVAIDLDSSDFMFRVNRKRGSGVGIPNLQVNRLATWSFLQLTWQLKTSVGGQESQPSRQVRLACSLDFDINTVPEHNDILPQATLPDLFAEFSTIASELAKLGDVR